EPTNHLDLDSSEALAESLTSYDGTLVFVSHNRSFVRRLATRIWNVENGSVEVYPGTLDEYMDSCRRRQAAGLAVAGDAAPKKGEPRAERPKLQPPQAKGEKAAAAPASAREDEKARKQREQEARKQRSRIKQLKSEVERCEREITALESQQ